MVRKKQEFWGRLGIFTIISILFASFMLALSPRFSFLGRLISAQDLALMVIKYRTFLNFGFFTRFGLAFIVFTVTTLIASLTTGFLSRKIRDTIYTESENALFETFITRLRFCYTRENLIEAIQQELEYTADCSVLLINIETGLVIYNSTSAYVSDPAVYEKLAHRFSAAWLEHGGAGAYLLDDDMQMTTKRKYARAILIAYGAARFFIICRYIRAMEPELLPQLFSAFKNYFDREQTLSKLLYYSELAQEWQMVADTQRSFLPKKIPVLERLEIGVYFKPLVNVSGDYYDIVPLDSDKTLIITGDVSGKGLAAALVMGVVINTIRIMEHKEDLAGLVCAVDSAIKRMNLLDKYTVVFLAVLDTKAMKIRYVNASMEAPMIFTKAAEGYKVKRLESNCSIIGIIDIDSVEIAEKPLYRGDLLFITTDGISEITDEHGVELGNTEQYIEAIKSFARMDPYAIAEKTAEFGLNYSAAKAFRDDTTILAVKIGE